MIFRILVVFVVAVAAAAPQARAADPWPSVINLRDIGGKVTREGLCVRRNVVYRSGNFDHTLRDDAESLVQRLHLMHYYDLRAAALEQDNPTGLRALQDAGVRYHNLPIDGHNDPMLQMSQPDPNDWSAFYGRTFAQHGVTFVQLMQALAEGNEPAVFGCTLGKDRTGIATALLLAALGVDDDAIVNDYTASTAGLAGHLDDMQAGYERLGISREDYARYWMTAHGASIRMFLQQVRQTYGGVVPALMARGMSQEALTAWRSRMLAVSLADCL